MPIYEFQCDACGEPFEELYRSASERRRPRCPDCGSRQVHKRFSTFALGGRASVSGAGGGGGGGRGCGTCSRSTCAGCH